MIEIVASTLTSPTKRNLTHQFDRSQSVTVETKDSKHQQPSESVKLERRNTVPFPAKNSQSVSTIYNTLFSPRHVLNSFFGTDSPSSSQDSSSHQHLSEGQNEQKQEDEEGVSDENDQIHNSDLKHERDLTLKTEEDIQKEQEQVTSAHETSTASLSEDSTDSLDDSEDIDDMDPLAFIAKLPESPPAHHRSRPAKLPKKEHHEPKYTLVLDLDETLVHCSTEELHAHDMKFPVWFNETEYLVVYLTDINY